MSCCMNSHLLYNHFVEKKKSINVWLKRKFNQNQPAKLIDKEAINLEESKYIKKVTCSMPKYLKDECSNQNLNSTISRVEDKDGKQPDKASTGELENSKTKHHQFKGSLNRDEWELFFVVDDDKNDEKLNNQQVLKDKNSLKKRKNENTRITDEEETKKSTFDNSDLQDFEWDDDFVNDEIILGYDEQDHLIDQK